MGAPLKINSLPEALKGGCSGEGDLGLSSSRSDQGVLADPFGGGGEGALQLLGAAGGKAFGVELAVSCRIAGQGSSDAGGWVPSAVFNVPETVRVIGAGVFLGSFLGEIPPSIVTIRLPALTVCPAALGEGKGGEA